MSDELLVTFTKSQILQGVNMDPGFKVCELSSLYESSSSTGKEGYTAEFTVLAPVKYEGIKFLCWYYDEIGMGNLKTLAEKILGHKIEPGKAYNFSALITKRLKVYTSQKTNSKTGEPMNNAVSDYAALSDEKAIVRE